MCKPIEAAIYVVNKSIDIANITKKDDDFLPNFTKVHKLLYIAHGHCLAKHGISLFDGKIIAHNCGPRIEGIDRIALICGVDTITEKIDEDNYIRLSKVRKEIIDGVLLEYGNMSSMELINHTRNNGPWKIVTEINGIKNQPEIRNDLIKSYFIYELGKNNGTYVR